MVISLVRADDRVADAIRAAEATTSGEIFCVVTQRVSGYLDVALAWAIGAALILPLGLVPFGFDPAWLPGMASSWEAAHLAARSLTVGQALLGYAMVQAIVFATVFALAAWTPLNRWITPRPIRRHRVRQAALLQLLAHGVQHTRSRTGVLIFASLQDRQVEIVADEGIHALVDPDVWGEIAAGMLPHLREGEVMPAFVQAVQAAGAVLAQHFPPADPDPNELADRLVIL